MKSACYPLKIQNLGAREAQKPVSTALPTGASVYIVPGPTDEVVASPPATSRQFRPCSSIPPGGVNFLGTTVQLPQQQQAAISGVHCGSRRGIASGPGVGWAGLGWVGS
jgi:hypothetical protein